MNKFSKSFKFIIITVVVFWFFLFFLFLQTLFDLQGSLHHARIIPVCLILTDICRVNLIIFVVSGTFLLAFRHPAWAMLIQVLVYLLFRFIFTAAIHFELLPSGLPFFWVGIDWLVVLLLDRYQVLGRTLTSKFWSFALTTILLKGSGLRTGHTTDVVFFATKLVFLIFLV